MDTRAHMKKDTVKILNGITFDKFINKITITYNFNILPFTHPSQVFRANFYIDSKIRKPITLLIFSNGTMFFQGSPKIPKSLFEEHTKIIIDIYKSLII